MPRLCLSLRETADRLGLSTSQLREVIESRELTTVYIGRFRLVRVRDLEEYEERRNAAKR